MEGNEKELNNVKVMLRSVLTSSKEETTEKPHLNPFCYQKFGYRNLDAFIESMPDVVKISRTPTGEIYHAVADESTAHIAKMVSKVYYKKRKSLKPARRRPAPRSAPFHSPWRSQQHIVLQPLRPWPGKRPPPKRTSRSHGLDYEAQQSQTRPYGRNLTGQQHHHLTVHTDGGRRKVDFQGPARLLLETPNQKQTQSYSVNRFEQPPRFRKLHEQQTPTTEYPVKKASPPRSASSPSRPPKKTSPKTLVQPVDMAKIKDGKKYYDTLIEYCKSNHISDLKFETMPSRLGQVYCYASSTNINKRVYGSGDLFGSSVEAEFAACRTACVELGLLNECVSILSCHTRHTFKTIDKLHEETLEELDFYENHIKQTLFASVTRNLKSLKDWYNYHEKMFEEEKEKILKHTDDLRKWITEYSDKLVDELMQTFARNANIISQEKYKLEQLQQELKEKIKLINKSKVKDDIEQIQKDIINESTNIKHFDIPLFIPKNQKNFLLEK
ncbi:unnamed protein product [Mytilus edulis]|uniref:HTH OST-type domain-containing protein n=1 Tax=Mytilus edulis TaxID=6550 RepID=A0A8S3SAN8_MYTED|nr:unnamed protein product [Mytilus edulis]